MKRAAEWFLTLHELPLERAHELITPATTTPDIDTDTNVEDIYTPSPYDNTLTAEEGLWSRSGWAGRS